MKNAFHQKLHHQLHHKNLTEFFTALQGSLSGDLDFSSVGVAMYTSDASNYRQVPLGIVYPAHAQDIKTTAALCHANGYPLLMRGGGTSQNGQCVNNAIIIDCSRFMNRVLEINVDQQWALVEPGIVCDTLKAAAEKHHLTFGPDPATHSRCTLGGMIGNNSCGPHSMLAGKTVENVLEIEILTSDGHSFWVGPTSNDQMQEILSQGGRKAEIYTQLNELVTEYADEIRNKFPNIKRRVSGYNLDQLLPENNFNLARALVGTEGTCVSILQARVRLIENPAHVRLVVLGFDDIFLAGDAVKSIMPFAPIAMEGLDWNIVGGLNDRNLQQAEVALLPEGRAWLLVELAAATEAGVNTLVSDFIQAMENDALVNSVLKVDNNEDVTALWTIREQGASATALALNPEDPDPIVGWEDTAVDPMQLGNYLRELYALVDRYEYQTSLYGHFGDGCIHARMTFDTRTKAGVAKWRRFSHDIASLVVKYGGSLSGEHGDGQAKAEFLPLMYGDKLIKAFEQFKSIWDPSGQMNPRKVVNPYRMDENLRYGPEYQTPTVVSKLHSLDSANGFGRDMERCIGMGKCRASSGAMCPSYQATGEERYSTRGRAHLLHELIRGELIQDQWSNKDIADSLEHCLSCKACQSACPTKVDIAAYKADFMHKHYSNNLSRPLHHWIFGRIGSWLPYAARVRPLSNAMLRGPLGKLSKALLKIEPSKNLPVIASMNFAKWAQQQAHWQDDHFYWHGQRDLPAVVLWADTVNAHYTPHLLISAINALNRCGFRVAIAKSHFCCGRPLFEYGMLDKAQQLSDNIVKLFYPSLPKQAQVIVLEPSCLSVFKDEMIKLQANSQAAQDLARRCMSLAQFLQQHGITASNRFKKAIVHFHCHDKSLQTHKADAQWIKACFEQVEEPEPGCCGMAGSFGLQTKTSSIGQVLVQKNLQPSITKSEPGTFVIANGFSCRSQIVGISTERVYHPVEIIEKSL